MDVANVREYSGNKRGFLKASPLNVYVGRPSPLGNPFVIGKHGTSEEVLAKYRDWIFRAMKTAGPVRAALLALKGTETLGCWCAPAKCHADIIIEAWNALQAEKKPAEKS